MLNMIFPAGLTIDYSDLSMEMVQHYSKKWNLIHTQMGKGVFQANITAVHTPRIQLAANAYSTGLKTIGDFPKGAIVLNSHIPNNSIYNVNNKLTIPNEIIVLSKGDEIDRVCSGPFDTHSIVIEEHLFYKVFYDFFKETPCLSLKTKRFYIKKNMIFVFHQTMSNWIDYLINIFPILEVKPEYEKLEYEILSQLFNCITFSTMKINRKKFPIETIRDFFDHNVDKTIDLSMITEEFNISESQLHNVFKATYGVTPKKYLRMLQLNAARKDLLIADPKYVTVSEIVMKYNFLNMSHFSKEYKNMFEQTPSRTLWK